MTYTKEQLSEAFKKLPQDIRNAIFSVDTATAIQEIGTKNQLMIDKVGELADETGLVMLGFTRPSTFISNLSDRLGIEKEAAKEIAEEINSRIFFPVRENLKKIHGMEEEAKTSETSANIPKPPENLPVSPASVPPAPKPKFGSEIKPSDLPAMPPPPAPAIPDAADIPKNGIFEAKTQEGVFVSPAVISEKIEPPKFPTPAPSAPETKKIDPYREQAI